MSSQSFSDVLMIKTTSFADERGSFSEIYNKKTMKDHGLSLIHI